MGPEPNAAAADLTDDAFLGGRLAVLQPAKGYRAGIDAVLLAAAVPAIEGRRQQVLDAGAGVGVVGLAIARRVGDAHITLVDIDAGLAELARSNAMRNGLADRVRVVVADVAPGGALLNGPDCPPGLAAGAFDHVVSNPPYYAAGQGTRASLPFKGRAHQMTGIDLDRWIAFLATAAAAGGRLTLIHRAEALAEVLAAIGGRFGGVEVLPVHAHAGEPARRIIVRAIKGSRAETKLMTGLVLHAVDGRYRAAIEAVLRDGAALDEYGMSGTARER